MFEQIVMFTAGFLVAYLIVKGIRSFRTTAMGLASLLCTGQLWAQDTGLYVSNSSPATIGVSWDRGTQVNVWSQQITPGQCSYPYVTGTGVAIVARVKQGDFTGPVLATYNVAAGGGHQYFTYTGVQPPQYTNYPGTIYITNGGPRSTIFELTITRTDQNLVVNFQDITIAPWGFYQDYLVLPYPWKWAAKKKFEWDDQGNPIDGGGGTNGTPNIGTNNIPPSPLPSPTPSTPNRDDPIGTNIAYPTNIYAPNQMSADRQNTIYLAEHLSRVIDQLTKQNKTLSGMSNSQSQIDYTPWWQNQSNKMSNLTNQLEQLTNNTAPLDDTNALVADFNTRLMQYSNQMSELWQGLYAPDKLGMFTNENWSYAPTGAPAPQASSLKFTLGTVGGVVHQMNFDYNQLAQDMQLVSDFWKISTWLGKWFAWLITFGLWIAVQYRLDSLLAEMHMLRAVRRPDSGANKKAWLVNIPLKIALIVGGVALFVVLPTALVTWLNTHSFANPLQVATPAQEVAANTMGVTSIVWGFVCHWWNGLLSVIPYATIISAVVTWIAFFHFSRLIAEIISNTWWAANIFIPSVVFLCLAVDAEATQLKVENLTGTNIVVSNNVASHSFPSGVTLLENIDSGQWQCGNIGQFMIPEDGKYVLRLYYDKAGSLLLAESGQEMSMMDCFLYGMGAGLGIFGSAWAVSAMWWGWRLRHGGES